MEANARLLIVDDDPDIRQLLSAHLTKQGYSIRAQGDGAGMRKALLEDEFQTVLLDLQLPDASGLTLLRELKEADSDLPVIMITAHGGVDDAVSAMRLGAHDFCSKPVDLRRLTVSVRNAVEHNRLRRRLTTLERGRRDRLEGMLGVSPAMQAVYRTIETVATTKAPVLITGESGTGKELAAQAIHALSPRRAAELVEVNCAAIPKDLLESELFGHEKAAFTGATERGIGRCERANGSTLFLDEIAEMEIGLQAKLLRFLEELAFYRVGGREKIRVDIRLVSATNQDPEAAMRGGRFREDLYYRLNVVRLELPPLRKRVEDIPLLAEAFLKRFSDENGRNFADISDDAIEALCAHNWPGNARELRNAIHQAVVMHDGDRLEASMLPEAVRAKPAASHNSSVAGHAKESTEIVPFEIVEREAIEHALRITGGAVARAATGLGLGQATIYRKVREYGLDLNQYKQEE